MLSELAELSTQLPSVRRHIRVLVEDLLAGRCVVWHVPRLAQVRTLCFSLRDACCAAVASSARIQRVSGSDDTSGGLPRFLAGELHPQSDPCRLAPGWGARDLLEHPDTPRVLILEITDARNGKGEQAGRLLQDWASAVGVDPDFRDKSARVVAVLSDPVTLPLPVQRSPLVSLRYYRRLISTSDVQTLLRMCESGGTNPEAELWARAVYSEVAGDDLALLSWLIRSETESVADLVQAVNAYAAPCGALASPPDGNRDAAWIEGRRQELAEQDPMDHAVAVARAEGVVELSHRVWRGQVRMLTPLIEEARIELCRQLTAELGDLWTEIEPPNDDRSVSLDGPHPTTDWGHLLHVWRSRDVRYRRGLQGLLDPVITLRDSRNRLAHHRPLSRFEFTGTLRALWRVRIGLGLNPSRPH